MNKFLDLMSSTVIPPGSLLLTPIAILTILTIMREDQMEHDQIASRTTFNQDTPYDFIIVGAGAAGSVVASRLTENPSVTVLLLESGGPESAFTDVPAMDAVNTVLLTESSKFIGYETISQKNACQAFPNSKSHILTGNVLGGGTTVNGMMYNRGGPDDFNGWVKNYNVTGWSYTDVLPYFKKSENNENPTMLRDSLHHSSGGPLTIVSLNTSQMDPRYKRFTESLAAAAIELGYKETDLNGASPLGWVIPQRTIKNGRRQSTSRAFLQPIYKSRPNLHILTQATVRRILFNGKTAIGVEFKLRGSITKATCTREVILSAGAINTPKLLMLSGVGMAGDLKTLKIPLVADLPVGHNFQDHVRIGGMDFTLNTSVFTAWTELANFANWEELYLRHEGELANDVYLHQGSFLNVRIPSVPTRGFLWGPSDLFIAGFATIPPLSGISPMQYPPKTEVTLAYYTPNAFFYQLSLFVTLNYVTSRGTIRLRSSDPDDPPIVDPNYLGDRNRDDINRAIAGYKLAMKMGKTRALQKLDAQPFKQIMPGCESKLPMESDAYIECKIRALSASEMHPCCAARMGSVGHPKAVLGPRLRVQGGVQHLRVVDASVMPSIVSGNPMAATIMIAEKASDMIKADNGLPQ